MVSPNPHRIVLPLLAASLLAYYGWTAETETLLAQPPGLFDDADGDFLPDSLEWLLLTDSSEPDSDRDGVGDFIEAVQGGYPRVADQIPLPSDDEMRVLATTRSDASGRSVVWVHAMFRLMNGLDTPLDNVMPWVDLAGTKVPVAELFRDVPLFWRVSETPSEGTLVVISTPVAFEENARNFLPFTFGISARLGGRPVSSSALYVDNGRRTSIVVAMDRDRVVAQTLREAQQEGPFEYANQICAMTLRVVGTSPAGLIVQVTSAKCEPAHGLRCSSACSMQGESVFVLPDGMSTVGSGR